MDPATKAHDEDPSAGTGDTEVLVVGAGPTGLMLAGWLTRLGVRVRVVDAKAGPVEETRAIVAHARTMEFYDQLGLGQRVEARHRHLDRVSVWGEGGRHYASVEIGGGAADLSPHPYFAILPQDVNEELLTEHLTSLGVAVEWRTELLSYTQDEQGVTALLVRDGRIEPVRTAYLAGCDGASSLVRRLAGINFSGDTYPHDYYVIDATAHGQLFEDAVAVRFDRGRYLLVIPMPGTDRFRIVGQLPDIPPGTKPDVEIVRPDIEDGGRSRIEAVHWFATYRVHHRVADRFRDRRAFLLGDAGHVHSPVGGQGMNTGLGDAVNLGWKLAQALRSGDSSTAEDLLGTYDPERRPFALGLVRTTDRVFGAMIRATPLGAGLRGALLTVALPALSRTHLLDRPLFRVASQTRLRYPGSPLSSGRAGDVRGGDRLPWVPIPGAGDNLAALSSLRWQVHVYGTATDDLRRWCAGRAVPLQTFPYTAAARRAGMADGGTYLVRPDGYVGLALATPDLDALDAYATRWLPRA